MIYLLKEPTALTQAQYEQALRLASPQRREKVLRYRFDADRKESLCAYLLLRHALRREYSITEAPLLAHTEGKPILAEHPHIHFNLSHCRRAVACVVSDGPVGVDVQDWARDSSRLAERICTPEEQHFISAAEHPEIAFAQIWTAKESYGKYTGRGIGKDVFSVNFVQNGALCAPDGLILQTYLFPNFALSCCSSATMPLRNVTISDLLHQE